MWASCWGIEMSRLAGSGREWHQLLELYAVSGALLGDPDGIYDPADHNDRLLLGLKGTISEAESAGSGPPITPSRGGVSITLLGRSTCAKH
jgi:hypothetical protein